MVQGRTARREPPLEPSIVPIAARPEVRLHCSSMKESTVSIPTHDGPMDLFVALPDDAHARPAMLVMQEAFGVNPHIKDVCARLAGEGYVAIAPDLFHRAGKGLVFDYGDLAKVMPAVSTVTNATLEADVLAALAHARKMPEIAPTRVGVVGFCMGGFTAFLAACRTDVRTAVCFYGAGLVRARPNIALSPLLPETRHIRAPILMFFGDADASIPLTDVDAIRAELKGQEKVHEIVVYPNAGHGFFCDKRAAYHEESARDAWTRTQAWLRARL